MSGFVKDMREKKKDTLLYAIIFILSFLFYLLWYWQDGVILTEDAQSYITMQDDREPGYCIFLALLRCVFGAEGSLCAAAVLQCLIAAVAACMLVAALRRRFLLGYGRTAVILLMQYGITLLNRFVAQRHYSYYNSIETEGLTYSLWIFFFLGILGILYDGKKKNIVTALVWSVVLISIRKQMLITLVILFLVLLYAGWKQGNTKGKPVRVLIVSLLIVLAGFSAVQLVERLYSFGVRGEFERHTGDFDFILGTELYLANEGMAEGFESDVTEALFHEIMSRADEKAYNIAYAGEGWQNIENHYSLSYDRIKFDIMMVVISEHAQQVCGLEGNWRDLYHKTVETMAKELLVPCIPGLIKLFGCNLISGMITTVLKVHRLLNLVALGIYVLYIAFMILLVRTRKQRLEGVVSSLPMAAVVLLSIVVNDAFTSVTIYPQMRYMLYNTALFYQAGALMVWEYAGIWRRGQRRRDR